VSYTAETKTKLPVIEVLMTGPAARCEGRARRAARVRVLEGCLTPRHQHDDGASGCMNICSCLVADALSGRGWQDVAGRTGAALPAIAGMTVRGLPCVHNGGLPRASMGANHSITWNQSVVRSPDSPSTHCG
jgi:hypothetical protein